MPRNPTWSRDELILALELYRRGGMLDDTDPEVLQLSRILNLMSENTAQPDARRFRNPSGVAMKLANFAALDASYPGVGLTGGGRSTQEVWIEFANDAARLKDEAARIRREVEAIESSRNRKTPVGITWIEEVVQAYRALGGVAHYSDVYRYIEQHTQRDLSEYAKWETIVQREVEEHSSDSTNKSRRGDQFYSVGPLGNGLWGLRELLPPTPVAADVAEPGPAERKSSEVSRIVRDNAVTKYLKQLYENRCQACGKVVQLPRSKYSEAHHLKPLGKDHNGPDIVSNVIVVCPEHHVEFDFGAIAIQPASLVIAHIDADSPINGAKLHLQPEHNLGRDYLKYHLENIFNK